MLVMEHVSGMSVADLYGEGGDDTPAPVYQQARELMARVTEAGISYPDLAGCNLIQCDHAARSGPMFLDGHNGWDPEFR